MYLVCMHPENKRNNYERIKVVDLQDEILKLMDYKISLMKINK